MDGPNPYLSAPLTQAPIDSTEQIHFPNPYDMSPAPLSPPSPLAEHYQPHQPPTRAQTQRDSTHGTTPHHLPTRRAKSVPSPTTNVPKLDASQPRSPQFSEGLVLNQPPAYAVPAISRPSPGANRDDDKIPYQNRDFGKSEANMHEAYMMRSENKNFSDLEAAAMADIPDHLLSPGQKKERTCGVKVMRCLVCCWFWEALWYLLRCLMCCCIWESLGCCGSRKAHHNGGGGIDGGGLLV